MVSIGEEGTKSGAHCEIETQFPYWVPVDVLVAADVPDFDEALDLLPAWLTAGIGDGIQGLFRRTSFRRDDGDSIGQSCLGQSIVVRDYAVEFVAEVECCREMNSVERSQDGWIEPSGCLKDFGREGNECHRVEDFPCPNDAIGSNATYGPHEFGAGQIA